MRISTNENDLGYSPYSHIMPATCTLDGKVIDEVETADDVKGEIVVFERDSDKKLIRDIKGNPQMKTLTGKVEIKLQCPTHKSYGAIRRPRCDCQECWAMWDVLSKK